MTDPADPAPPPPALPADTVYRQVPPEIREFVGCTVDQVTLAPGRIGWMGLPAGIRPDVRFAPGPSRGSVEITVGVVELGIIKTKITAEVRDGVLHVDTSEVPAVVPGLGDVRQAIAVWVRGLDTWLTHNGKELTDIRLRRGRLRLGKVSLAAAVLATSRRALRRPPAW